MAEARICDLCGRFIVDRYLEAQINIVPVDFAKGRLSRESKYTVRDLCENCVSELRALIKDGMDDKEE